MSTDSLQIPEIRENAENTMEIKYGYKYASQIPEIKERESAITKKKRRAVNLLN